jgi:hypothetical protein
MCRARLDKMLKQMVGCRMTISCDLLNALATLATEAGLTTVVGILTLLEFADGCGEG